MKRQKMITLCPTTYEIAQSMPNFSAWVRKKLIESHDSVDEVVISLGFRCDECGEVYHSHKDLDGIPHATRMFGSPECQGTVRRGV